MANFTFLNIKENVGLFFFFKETVPLDTASNKIYLCMKAIGLFGLGFLLSTGFLYIFDKFHFPKSSWWHHFVLVYWLTLRFFSKQQLVQKQDHFLVNRGESHASKFDIFFPQKYTKASSSKISWNQTSLPKSICV